MTEEKRKEILDIADMLQGEINLMCVTNDRTEFDSMFGYAKRNLDKLFMVIDFAKFHNNGENND